MRALSTESVRLQYLVSPPSGYKLHNQALVLSALQFIIAQLFWYLIISIFLPFQDDEEKLYSSKTEYTRGKTLWYAFRMNDDRFARSLISVNYHLSQSQFSVFVSNTLTLTRSPWFAERPKEEHVEYAQITQPPRSNTYTDNHIIIHPGDCFCSNIIVYKLT